MQSSQEAAVLAIRLHLAAHDKTKAWLAQQMFVSPFYVGRRMSSEIAWDMNDIDKVAAVFGTTREKLLAAAEAIEVPSLAVAS